VQCRIHGCRAKLAARFHDAVQMVYDKYKFFGDWSAPGSTSRTWPRSASRSARRWAGDVVQMTPENWFGDAKSGQTATEAI
jgi:hypothetical protein